MVGIAQIFGGVAAGDYLEADGAPLERRTQLRSALAMRMVEAFGDAQERSKAADDALVRALQRGIRSVVAGWLRFGGPPR